MIKKKILTSALTFVMLGSLASCSSKDATYGYPVGFEQVIDSSKAGEVAGVVETAKSKTPTVEGFKASGRIYRKDTVKAGTFEVVASIDGDNVNYQQTIDFTYEEGNSKVTVKNVSTLISSEGKLYNYLSIESNNDSIVASGEVKSYVPTTAIPASAITSIITSIPVSDLLDTNSYKVGLTSDDLLVSENISLTHRVIINPETGTIDHEYYKSFAVAGLFGTSLAVDYSYAKQSAISAPSDASSYVEEKVEA